MLMAVASKLHDRVAPTCMCPARSGALGRSAPPVPSFEPLRLMFLTSGLAGDGTSDVAENLLARMNRNRFIISHCSLHELGPAGRSLSGRVESTSQLLRHPLDLTALVRLGRQLKGGIDALLTVGSGEPMWWGCLAARWAGTPVVLTLLDQHPRPTGLTLATRLIAHWPDGLIADGPEQRQHLVNRGLRDTSIHVIPPGIDTHRFSFQPADVFAVRRQFQLPSGAPLCGLLLAGGGERFLERVRELVRRVRFQYPQAQFVLIAEDVGSSSPLVRQRDGSQWCGDGVGIEIGVHVVRDADQLPRILPALNVLAVTARARDCRRVVWQAMAGQVPVIAVSACDFGGSHEGGTDHWVSVTDAGDLPGQIIQLVSDPLRARHLGEKARQFVLQHRSLDLMVRRYEQLIVEIHQRKRSGPGAVLPASLHDTVEFCGATS